MTENQPTQSLQLGLLPETLPVFPILGAVMLPRSRLPLHVFEKRYLSLVDDALGQGRILGLVQPRNEEGGKGEPSLYSVGCAGRITSFSETDDGRYLVNLIGLSRFRIQSEEEGRNGYRIVRPEWTEFETDITGNNGQDCDFDREKLLKVLQGFFKGQNIAADWDAVQNSEGETLISSLAMICPLAPNEKQALLETKTLAARAKLLITLIEMASLPQALAEAARH